MCIRAEIIDLLHDHQVDDIMDVLVDEMHGKGHDFVKFFLIAAADKTTLASIVMAWYKEHYNTWSTEFDDLLNQLIRDRDFDTHKLMPMIMSFYINTGSQHEYIDMMSDAYRASFPDCYTPAPSFTWDMACENRWTEGLAQQMMDNAPTLGDDSETQDDISNITRQMCGR